MLPGRRTDTGAIYVTQGPPPAGTPLVGGIAVSPAGVIYASQSVVPVFSPLDLFQNNEQGAWYDPSDLSTMFQDSAGTTPVTADGQPVGLILDKSGRGNHASQATAASRPLYKTDGTYHWLQFDGVDDSLSTAAIDFTGTDKMSVFSGHISAVANTDQTLVSTGPSTVGSFTINPQLTDGANRAYFPVFGTSYGRVDALFEGTAKHVTTTEFDLSGTSVMFLVDTAAVAVNGVAGSGGAFSSLPLLVGRSQVDKFFSGNIYSLIIRGALSTTQQITDTETWVNSKTGAY